MSAPHAPWVSFDCYGTLVDWRAGMLACFTDVVGDAEAAAILERYHQHEPSLQPAPFASYRQVMSEAFRRAGHDLGLDLDSEAVMALPDGVGRWPVFPEVPGVLAALREGGRRIAILSNVDDYMITDTLPRLGAEVDLVITSEQVQSYKPSAGHFDELQRRTGVSNNDWVHVGCSYFHDVEPAVRRGIAGVMVNRDAQPGPFAGAATVLTELTSLPGSLVAGLDATAS